VCVYRLPQVLRYFLPFLRAVVAVGDIQEASGAVPPFLTLCLRLMPWLFAACCRLWCAFNWQFGFCMASASSSTEVCGTTATAHCSQSITFTRSLCVLLLPLVVTTR